MNIENEKLYAVELAVVSGWLKRGLITQAEYDIIHAKIKEKYNPIIGAYPLTS